MSKDTREMVRYGKDKNGQRKSALWTVRKDGYVYWGVSRCRLSTDKFNKVLGMEIAKGRALKALALVQEGNPMHNNHMGVVAIDNIKEFLTWFKSI